MLATFLISKFSDIFESSSFLYGLEFILFLSVGVGVRNGIKI